MKSAIFAAIVTAIALSPISAIAADFVVSPAIVDWEGQRGDEFRIDLTLTNPTSRTFVLWPYVGDLNPDDGSVRQSTGPHDEPTRRLGSWMETPRDEFNLKPGQERTVPVKVRIGPRAEEGTYYAVVAFPTGENQTAAHAVAADAVKATFTVRVKRVAHEQINVIRFFPERRFFTSLPASLVLTLNNGGDADTAVVGAVRIFDRNGSEAGEVALAGDAVVAQGKDLAVDVSWSGPGLPGRYKALAQLSYGKKGSITDTAYFWYLPWWLLAAMAGVILVVAIVTARMVSRHHRKQI